MKHNIPVNRGALMKSLVRFVCGLWAASLLVCPCIGRADSSPAPANTSDSVTTAKTVSSAGHTFSAVGVGMGFSPLGIGIQAGTPLATRVTLRFGANFFSYNRSFTNDGIIYDGKLSLRSFDALVDLYPFRGGFHVSPGVMIHNGNQLTATMSVPGNSVFTLNSTSYMSAPSNPVGGNGSLQFDAASPMLLLGF